MCLLVSASIRETGGKSVDSPASVWPLDAWYGKIHPRASGGEAQVIAIETPEGVHPKCIKYTRY